MDNKELLGEMGVDYQVTLPRFVDSEEFYIAMLKKFLEDDNQKKLNECLENGNYEEAFTAAHTLKGVSGNLGLGILNDYIVPLTEELRNPPYDATAIHDYLQKVNDKYEICVESIEKLQE